MGKVKRQQKSHKKHGPHQTTTPGRLGIKRRQHSQNGKLNSSSQAIASSKNAKQNSQPDLRTKVPFTRYDRVLLVGEGDFSFTLSLARNHKVGAIVATSYDSNDELLKKYPQVEETLRQLKGASKARSAVQAEIGQAEKEWNGFSASSDSEDGQSNSLDQSRFRHVTVLHSIDATSLSKAHRKVLGSHGPFTKIVFNFPHTGGLSTDVNRQVRANQELLVNFLNAAKPLLATEARPAKPMAADEENANEYEAFNNADDSDGIAHHNGALNVGHILITLFEGEPYTLWNIRDLARHCGFQVIESFKFNWGSYPEYKHARTIGEITTGKDRSNEGKRKGAWRGEERDARCYVLGLKDHKPASSGSGKRKRRNDSDESE